MNTKDVADIPGLAGVPEAIGTTVMIHEEDGFRVVATELAMMWRWDLFEGERHLHTGCAQRPESCVVAAKSKIRFFQRPIVAHLLHTDGD
ncbi:hypothetical protein CJ010_10830 [Azoarcus sp. DD4]|uniref:hypothetical protein n=1 Tax=Azoarcus sp. DD4 TaxID=2027405 RepID=UPI001128C81F|nr:hypothetical protein [Azoarcus sp. DD4]QDF96985.1 hypothetical protein CJ010_10830 [Azoarcus sp. DD4]